MRICPVCPVMEIIVPVDVTDVEQEAAQALWDLQSRLFMHNIRFSFVLSRQAVRLPCSQSPG